MNKKFLILFSLISFTSLVIGVIFFVLHLNLLNIPLNKDEYFEYIFSSDKFLYYLEENSLILVPEFQGDNVVFDYTSYLEDEKTFTEVYGEGWSIIGKDGNRTALLPKSNCKYISIVMSRTSSSSKYNPVVNCLSEIH